VRFDRPEPDLIGQIVEEALGDDPSKLTRAIEERMAALDDVLGPVAEVRRLAGRSGLVARLPFDIRFR
jgi:hypothetical protein